MGFWCHKNLVLVLGARNPAQMKTIAKLSSSDMLISSTVKKTCAELYISGQKISGVWKIRTLMVQVPLMCSVIRKQPVEGGLCSRSDCTAQLISAVDGMTTNAASVT